MNSISEDSPLSWEGDLPRSKLFDDVYYSIEDGLAEARYVFLQGNCLAERWSKLTPGTCFTIIETGFGTGLNFLAAWELWDSMSREIPSTCSLHFISIEKFPLCSAELQKAHRAWPQLSTYSERLTKSYPPQTWHELQTIQFSGENLEQVLLTLIFQDAKTAFDNISIRKDLGPQSTQQDPLLGEQKLRADAWFLDGFAPAKNPDMWSDELFNAMGRNSNVNSTFATFTAAGVVRRKLISSGFHCAKQKGFGKKREMLVGLYQAQTELDVTQENSDQKISKSTAANTASTKTRHFSRSATQNPCWVYKSSKQAINATKRKSPSGKNAIVIGAGLAGCHVANALAKRGFAVSVIDKGNVASGASSNLQGAVYTRLSTSEEPLSYFNRSAQLFADAFYEQSNLYRLAGAQCGVIHQAIDKSSETRLLAFSKKYNNTKHFSFVTAKEATNIAGINLKTGALLASQSGWLSPVKVCQELLKHDGIKVLENFEALSLERHQEKWSVCNQSDALSADICIVTNSFMANKFRQCFGMPLQKIRGQVNHTNADRALGKVKSVVCGHGYLTPSTIIDGDAINSIGATFNLKSESLSISETDTRCNLDALLDLSSSFSEDSLTLYEKLPAKAGFRTSTPDYLPIIGPVPNMHANLERFKLLSKKANADIDSCGEYHPGLYCSLGFGSRGLAYTPMAANILAQLITGHYLPVSIDLYRHLHPARFAIRALIKNQTFPAEN